MRRLVGRMSKKGALASMAIAFGVLAAGLAAGSAFRALEATSAVTEEAPQRGRWGRRRGYDTSSGYLPPEIDIQNMPYNGRFTFNRVRFTPSYWRPGPYAWGLDLFWNHDYPRAERNLMEMLDELTTIRPNMGGGNIYELSDPEFFRYPWAYLSEPGYWTLNDEEVENLRNYLLKGGFLIIDDMQGYDLQTTQENLNRVLPGVRLEILDTTHEIFNCFFEISQQDIFNQAYRYGMPVIFGVYEDNDPSKRLLVVINHNQDIGDSWEWSNSGFVPIELSNNSYKLGINYVVYAMTH